MKHEWKRHEREIYRGYRKPRLVTISRQSFVMLPSMAIPESEAFAQQLSVLFSVAYRIKMQFKALCCNDGQQRTRYAFEDFTMYPLEVVWQPPPEERLAGDTPHSLMIRQPDWITRDMFEAACETVKKKSPHPLLNDIVFDAIDGGKCVQALRNFSTQTTANILAEMDIFTASVGLKRKNQCFREIHLWDMRKKNPKKPHSILHYWVE